MKQNPQVKKHLKYLEIEHRYNVAIFVFYTIHLIFYVAQNTKHYSAEWFIHILGSCILAIGLIEFIYSAVHSWYEVELFKIQISNAEIIENEEIKEENKQQEKPKDSSSNVSDNLED